MAQQAYERGLALYRGKKYAESIEEFDSALSVDSCHKQSLLRKGVALLRLEDPESFAEINSCIERALAIDPNYKEAIVAKGHVLMAALGLADEEDDVPGLLQQAFECVERALQLDGSYVKALVLKQALHGRMNDYQSALQCSNSALALKPHSTSALLLRATMLMFMKQHKLDTAGEEPLDLFDKILAIDPSKEEAWFAKGHILLEQGLKGEAVQCFTSLRALNGNFCEKAQMLVDSLTKNNNNTH